jgi:eukaryotic-like serine/threonine-protein kinase
MVQLNHPKIVQVLDFGEQDGHHFIVMEHVSGMDCLALLRTCARRRCRPTTTIAVHIIAEILDALDYAHNQKNAAGAPLGIVHRDISPSNIFISDLGEVKLADFGIARAENRSTQTETGALKGKYGYMAPEVVAGTKMDHRADLFSAGVVLTELLMIRRLFIAATELEVLLQVRDARLDRLNKFGQHIQPDLRKILDNALARDPDLRYQDAASFRDALHRFLFEQKRMVRSTDVRQFLKRLREDGPLQFTPSSEIQLLSSPSSVEQPSSESEQAAPPVEGALPFPDSSTPPTTLSVPTSLAPPPPAEPLIRKKRSGTEYSAQTRERLHVVANKRSPAIALEIDLEQAVNLSGLKGIPTVGTMDESEIDKNLPSGVLPLEALAEEAIAFWQGKTPSVIGRKRRIPLGPPPKPEPVPTGLPQTGEEPRIGTDEMIAAMSELEESGLSSARDFHSSHGSHEADQIDAKAMILSEPQGMIPAPRPLLSLGKGLELPAPKLQGDLSEHSLFRLLFRLAVTEETGLITLHTEECVKEIYLVDGDPQYVTSDLPAELFGQYLVQKGVISQGELSLALAMLPHFEGKLGDALVALKLLRPVQVLRHLTHQVRQKLLNAFSVEKGLFIFYEGTACEQESAPLGLDAFEVIGAGVMALPEPIMIRRLQPWMDMHLRSVSSPPVPPEVFRLGARPRQVFDELDGRFSLIELLRRYDDPDQRQTFARMIYLLLETRLAAE